MNFIDVIILSIVEGVTEFLPISSTAHLQIVQNILNIPATDFVKSFTLIIQVGALLGTTAYIWKKRTVFHFSLRQIVVACIPTLLVGFLMYQLIKNYFFGNLLIIGSMLILGGIVMMMAEQYIEKRKKLVRRRISLKQSIILGTAQALAVIPGVSRSGAVLIAGYFSDIEKKHLAQFTFLIGLPVALAASVYDVAKTGFSFTASEIFMTSIGVLIAGVFSYYASGWFLRVIINYSLRVFAWYRIVLGIIIVILTF
jgi:undecaprenyl-diphosphatase